MELSPCIECNKRTGHPILGGSCTRCARDGRLFVLREIADQLELAWSDYCDQIYRVEVFEGERVPPSKDRGLGNGVQGDPATGLSSTNNKRRFSTPMKQPIPRPETQDDEEMTDDEE